MPGFKSESFSAGDQSWLGSTHGIRNARTEHLDPADFSGKAVNGVIPSGTALAMVSGKLAPYDAGGSGGAEKLVGFLLTDQSVSAGARGVPVFDHGRVKIANLPDKAFTAPEADKNLTTIVFIPKGV